MNPSETETKNKEVRVLRYFLYIQKVQFFYKNPVFGRSHALNGSSKGDRESKTGDS